MTGLLKLLNSIVNTRNSIGRNMLLDKKYIHIGKNSKVEDGAIVGYKPVRNIENLDLNIGQNSFIMTTAIIYGGVNIGDSATIAHNSIIREENNIGNNFCLWVNSIVDYGCNIGNNVKIHSNVYIAQFTTIEDDVFVAPGVTVANDLHPKCKLSKECMKGPHVKSKAVIGANVTINPFIEIGEGAIVGSGSVVTKNIPAHKVACGNPAKVVTDVSDLKCKTGLTDFPYRTV